MKKLLFTAATVTAAAVLSAGLMAGCGGSGMNMGSGSTAITGKVADGYLVGATVFLDKNGNYQPDAGEPSAVTDQNGAYSLTVDPAEVGRYPIVAIATKGFTVDKDSGQPVADTYILSLPATAVSGTVDGNFVSPMSTQLRVLMESGNYPSMQDAMNAMGAKLGMSAGTNMLGDYVAANNTTMHTAAKNMASLMGSQMPQVLVANGTTTTVDVGRYQGMMVAIFKNMSSIKGSGPNSQSAMANLMGTMTTTLQGTKPGQSFNNVSTSIRAMMGGMGSTVGGGMMK